MPDITGVPKDITFVVSPAEDDKPVAGKIRCKRCHGYKLPDEMNANGLCLICLGDLKEKNKGKPRPTHPRIEVKRNSVGWIDRPDNEILPEAVDVLASKVLLPIPSQARQKPQDQTSIDAVLEDFGRLLALANRRIAALEAKLDYTSHEDNNSQGMEGLRDRLHELLKDRHAHSQTNGYYVKDLYGNRGKLKISKSSAFRLRDSCRTDTRFKVEKANSGLWLIKLNIYMK